MYNKNDPLVHSVKAIMEQNEFRRRVETKLCEELGIYSRKQLPREHLANYDALLEQRIEEAAKEKSEDKSKKSSAKLTRKDEEDKDIPNSLASYRDRIYQSRKKELRKEELVGNQHKIDANKNNRVDAHDFKLLRAKKEMQEQDDGEETREGGAVTRDGKPVVSPTATRAGERSATKPAPEGPSAKDREALTNKIKGIMKESKHKKKPLEEKKLTDAEMSKREEIVKSMKKGAKGFKSRYGERAKEVMYATATKQAKKLAENNVSIDVVMEEIARNLGEAKMKKVMEQEQDPNKPDPQYTQPLSQRERQAAPSQAASAMTPSTVNRGPSNTSDNSLRIKIGGRVARPDNTPPVQPGKAERLSTVGQVASALTPLGASTRAVAAGTAAIQAGKNLTAGVTKGLTGSTRNVARTSTGTYTTPGGATKTGEAIGRVAGSTPGKVAGAAGAGAIAAGAMRGSDDSTASASDTATSAPESKPVPTGISDTASDERDAGAPRFAGAPTPPPRPAAAGRPAAARPAAARPAATAAAPVDQHAKSKSMFQAAQDREDRGESGGSAAFFAADKQRTAELRGMQESKSLTSTINKILKG